MKKLCMEPILVNDVICNKNWIHQIKWDGIRALISIDNNELSIKTRNDNDITNRFPELYSIKKQLKVKNIILDGEIVVFNAEGKPSFNNILKRNSAKKDVSIKALKEKYPAKYIIFDILSFDRKKVLDLKLYQRQIILKNNFISSQLSVLTDSFDDGIALYEKMKGNKMEGIVSKNINSRYTFGKKHNDWYKTKITKKMLCVITGINYNDNLPSSLSLGIYKDNKLINVGNVYSGLIQADLNILNKYFKSSVSHNNHQALDLKLTCWIKFLERSDTGRIRNPVLLGFSDENYINANGRQIII